MKRFLLMFGILLLVPLSMMAEKEPYAVLSDDNTVLTFYYDENKEAMGGKSFTSYGTQGWNSYASTITTAVFDASFADCTSLTSTAYWFFNCTNLNTITGIENLKTGNMTSMRCMFSSCSSLTSLDLSHFDTGKVTDMRQMFSGCSNLTSLDLSHFDTGKVTDMRQMFYNCASLVTIYAGEGWSTASITQGYNMFNGCTNLVGGIGTEYDANYTNFTYARIDKEEEPGYFTQAGAQPFTLRAYAVLSDDNTTLTFYFDDQKETRSGMGIGPFSSSSARGWNSNISTITTVVFDASFANYTKLTSTAYWFNSCTNLNTITGIENLKTGNVTNMSSMFSGCSSLTSLDLSHFDTGKVTDMRQMFYNCASLVTIYAGEGWSTASITQGYSMFNSCTNLVGGIGTEYDANYTNFTYARIDKEEEPGYFTQAGAQPFTLRAYAVLSDDNTTLTFYFDDQKETRSGMGIGPFSSSSARGWNSNISTITTVVFDASFANYTKLTSTAYWFLGCTNLNTITGIENLKTGNVTSMYFMFHSCSGLTSLDVSHFDTGKVTKMDCMFNSCSSLTSLDLSNFDTGKVMSMSYMFYRCYKLTSLDVSHFDTGNVTDMVGMFNGCHSLTSLDVTHFGTENVTVMEGMFDGCHSLTSLDVTHFDTGNVTHMSRMFDGCYKLTSLDVSHFETGKVVGMSFMFSGCSGLTSLDLSNFDTGNVMSMGYMFSGCSKLTSLDLSHFDTGNVTNMSEMFSGCSGLTNLDLSNFDTGNVTDMPYMFSGCSGLTNIYCNDEWSCSLSFSMFKGCTNLPGFNSSNITVDYAHPGDGGYFTYKYEVPNAVGDDYWMTYYTDVRNIKADENTTVYTATLNSDATELTLTEVTDKTVPRGQAVLLKSTVSNPLLYTQTGEVGDEAFADNSLRGTQREKATADVEGTVYTLAVENGHLGFYRYTGATLGARKAYLVVPGAAAVRSIRIVDGSETTGISETTTQPLQQCYDLQGRRVSQPQRGLYIVNGKKMVKQ